MCRVCVGVHCVTTTQPHTHSSPPLTHILYPPQHTLLHTNTYLRALPGAGQQIIVTLSPSFAGTSAVAVATRNVLVNPPGVATIISCMAPVGGLRHNPTPRAMARSQPCVLTVASLETLVTVPEGAGGRGGVLVRVWVRMCGYISMHVYVWYACVCMGTHVCVYWYTPIIQQHTHTHTNLPPPNLPIPENNSNSYRLVAHATTLTPSNGCTTDKGVETARGEGTTCPNRTSSACGMPRCRRSPMMRSASLIAKLRVRETTSAAAVSRDAVGHARPEDGVSADVDDEDADGDDGVALGKLAAFIASNKTTASCVLERSMAASMMARHCSSVGAVNMVSSCSNRSTSSLTDCTPAARRSRLGLTDGGGSAAACEGVGTKPGNVDHQIHCIANL